jgi:hypothetical protein
MIMEHQMAMGHQMTVKQAIGVHQVIKGFQTTKNTVLWPTVLRTTNWLLWNLDVELLGLS